MTRRLGRWTLLLELAMLAASLGGAGPVGEGVRIIGLVVVAVLGALVIFVAGGVRGRPARPTQAAVLGLIRQMRSCEWTANR